MKKTISIILAATIILSALSVTALATEETELSAVVSGETESSTSDDAITDNDYDYTVSKSYDSQSNTSQSKTYTERLKYTLGEGGHNIALGGGLALESIVGIPIMALFPIIGPILILTNGPFFYIYCLFAVLIGVGEVLASPIISLSPNAEDILNNIQNVLV